jgi:alkane 1-monooxygenase
MICLAYLPPVWRRVMDRRVLAHYGGDISRANLAPHRRAALLARYGGV